MRVPLLWVADGAVIDENTVVLVGGKLKQGKIDPETFDSAKLDPNGAIVDLAKKTARPFTNGHRAVIRSVSASRGRVATASTNRDPVVRVWDLKAGKGVAAVEFGQPDEQGPDYEVRCFHKSDRVAVAAGDRVVILDPAKPNDGEELAPPPEVTGWASHLAISPDDTRLAWTASLKQDVFLASTGLVVWDAATRKAAAISLLPEKVRDPQNWHAWGAAFGPAGLLIARRHGSDSEVPDGVAEKDAPADRRGLVRVDMAGRRVTPLGMGTTIYTIHCALDPTGTWLAAVGSARSDKQRPDGIVVVGELRVYHLPSGSLDYREQFDDIPNWVAFTPSGKRIVVVEDQIVRWWDVKGP